MKKTLTHSLTALLLILLSTVLAAAQDCSNVKESTDEFKNEVVKKAQIGVGPVTWNWQLMLEQHGDKYTLGLRVMNSGDIRYIIKKDEIIQIKLEDGNVIELVANNDYLPVASIYGGAQVVTIWLPAGYISVETLKKLAASPITAIRLTIQGTEATVTKFKDKQTRRVMEAAGCIGGVKS